MTNPFNKSLPHADPLWVEHGYGTRFQGFQNLMRMRIRDILLVSSLYDLYVFEEDGTACTNSCAASTRAST